MSTIVLLLGLYVVIVAAIAIGARALVCWASDREMRRSALLRLHQRPP